MSEFNQEKPYSLSILDKVDQSKILRIAIKK